MFTLNNLSVSMVMAIVKRDNRRVSPLASAQKAYGRSALTPMIKTAFAFGC